MTDVSKGVWKRHRKGVPSGVKQCHVEALQEKKKHRHVKCLIRVICVCGGHLITSLQTIMGDAVNVSIPCLDPLETVTVAGGLIHIHRISNLSSGSSSQPMALLLLHDLRNILSDQNISEQAALSRLSRLQKRFYTFEELGLMPPSCAVSSLKSKHELPDAVIKQIKTSSKANGMWFVTVDAALKIAFKFCTPQDAIRVSLDLSPFLAGTDELIYCFHFLILRERCKVARNIAIL